MRVLITGGRDFADRDQIFEELDKLHGDSSEIELVIVSGSSAADKIVLDWIKARKVKIWVQAHGSLLEKEPDVLLAFHGAPAEVIARCKAARIYVEVIPARILCEHTNPSAWNHKTDDKGRRYAECPHCRKFMGYVDPQSKGSL